MNRPSVIALGFFDGVHRGHAALLQKAKERAQELNAESAVFTFDRPPKEVVTGKQVLLINSADDRREIMQRVYGIDRVILAPFDQNMMHCSWQDFITELLVRENGDMERAAQFLGHRHCLSRTVCHGQRFGRTIGIPTVNLTVPEGVLVPRRGVYITRVYLPDGRSFPGVTNVGVRPTVSCDGNVTVETFLLDFHGDLYGQQLRLEFFRHLRGEIKFASAEELKNQIHCDIAAVRDYFAQSNNE